VLADVWLGVVGGMCAPAWRAKERNGLAVRGPSRRAVGFIGLRDFYEGASLCIDHPDVLVTPLVEFLSGTIGNKSDLSPVG